MAGQQTTPSTVPHTPGLTGYAGSTAPTNNLAVVSFVAGIASLFLFVVFVLGIALFGYAAGGGHPSPTPFPTG